MRITDWWFLQKSYLVASESLQLRVSAGNIVEKNYGLVRAVKIEIESWITILIIHEYIMF